ncbi:MAG: hypothetical protein HQL67_11925 [Magnetococcales bacterium]|nr:hypothetical protein [Magnetococcales bacterium]
MKTRAKKKWMDWRNVPERVLVLDIEATGLQADSTPIEIAYGDPLESWVNAFLIRPHPDWEDQPWDPQVKALTGITPELLSCARPAADVARIVAADLARADLILSDAPAWDKRWLMRLLDLAPVPVNIEIHDFQNTLNTFNPLRRYLSTHRCLNLYDKSEHRAGGDVIRLLRVYRRALPVPLWEQQYCPLDDRGFGQKKRPAFIAGIPE